MAQRQSTAEDDRRRDALRAELAERISGCLPEDGSRAPMEGLLLVRASYPTEPLHSVSSQAFCVIAQGSKLILLGDETYRYDPEHYLLTTAALPVVSNIVEASPELPYLSLRLDLDPALVSSVMVETGHLTSASQSNVTALDVSRLSIELLDATLRLVRLVDKPDEARFLAPMVIREIVYRLLMGAQGGRLRQLAVLNGSRHRISEAIARLREEYDQPLRIEEIAAELGMSISGFHHHFKAVTSMSPLQYQKRLRLQEARRLMLGEDLDAASAGYRVGYDDPSYFNRDYKKLFGEPPLRHVERLRERTLHGRTIVGSE
jgi:AraC-like DNA-binding protein